MGREHTRDGYHRIQVAFELHHHQVNFSALTDKSMFLMTFASEEEKPLSLGLRTKRTEN